MASSALNQKSNFHARSNSLPSRPHPLIPQIDEHLCRLKSNEAASSSSSLLSSIVVGKLIGLRDLYELVDSLFQLPLTQKSLAQHCNDHQVNKLLNGSLRLLDACGVAKDALLQAKEDTQQLETILRRRRGDDAGFTNEAKAYVASRKKAKKAIAKSLRDLKSKCGLAHMENDVEATFGVLLEVEGITMTVFESLLSYIRGTKLQPKSTSWSLVSKLVHSKRVTCEGDASEMNEFEKVDAVLCTLIGHKNGKAMSTENAQIELQKLESSIQDLEDGVECLLRLLIKTRVSTLNILSH